MSILGLVVLYPALGWLGFAAASRAGNSVAIWCASIAWMATLVATPKAHWRAVIIGGVLAATVLMILLSAPPIRAIAFVLADTIAVNLCARAIVRRSPQYTKNMQLLALATVATFAHTLMLSLAGGWLLAALESEDRYGIAWSEWMSISFSGALVALPFVVLQLSQRAPADDTTTTPQRLLGLGLMVVLMASAFVIANTGGMRGGLDATPGWIIYTPLVCAVALSMVWPMTGSALATTILAAMGLIFLFYGERLFGPTALAAGQMSQWRWYLASAALLSSLLAALTIDMRRMRGQIDEWKARYESTLLVAKLLHYEVKLPSGVVSWTGDTVAHFGVAPSAIATIAQWVDRVHPADRPRLLAFMQDVAEGDESPADLRIRALLANGQYTPLSLAVSGVTVFEGAIDSVRGKVQLAASRKRGRLQLYRFDPSSQAADNNTSSRPAVMMIHGIGGSEHDFGPLYKVLGTHGFDPQPLTLPGHRGHPEDLLNVTAEDWIAAADTHYRKLRARYDVVHVMGISLGALIALEIAKAQEKLTGKLILISSPVFIDGWAVPWYYALRFPLYRLSLACKLIKVEEEEPFGVKDPRIRAIVAQKFARGESYHYAYVPLGCVREIDRLRDRVRKPGSDLECQTLVIHSTQDDLTSARSAEWLKTHLGEKHTKVVLLNNSYHMVCIDNDRELVAQNVVDFLNDGEVSGSLNNDGRDAMSATVSA